MLTESRRVSRWSARWVMPALVAVVGIVYLLAATAGGRLQLGLEMFGVMAVCAIGLVLLGRRSETIRGLAGPERDERFALIDLRATASTAVVLILAILGGFVFEIARGHSGAPYLWLGVLAGVAYLVSVAILRWRG